MAEAVCPFEHIEFFLKKVQEDELDNNDYAVE